ncbi:MAG: VCBS repeat-containing protein, partial [Candidatus Krumholzibacteria bacterium]|nr:VCBS repeat-containing protein [Candidatus Krumholzibacteria bacterium]
FGAGTTPSSSGNSGVGTGIEVRDISAAGSVMSFSVRFSLPFGHKRVAFDGKAKGISPIPADLDGVGGEEFIIASVIAADTGLVDTGVVYIVPDAGAADWDGNIELMIKVVDAIWAGSPVLDDIDRDDTLEVFITSEQGSLHAFKVSGSSYPVDDDDSPGSLALRGSYNSSPMLVEADGDTLPEVLVLSSTGDSTFCYLVDCGSLPGTGWSYVGNGVIELPLVEGRLASHPARGIVQDGNGETLDGFYFLTTNGDDIDLHFVGLFAAGRTLEGIELLSRTISGGGAQHYLLVPSAGDIDRDGSDEMIVAIPGTGLVYYSPFGGLSICTLMGSWPSSPALGDIDGDGILETVLQDEAYLYLLTGYGVPLSGWPVRLSDRVIELEKIYPPASPVIGDLNGDDRMELLFSAGGDLHAYGLSGEPLDGWPIPGEGDGSGSPALLAGSAGELYIFFTGAYDLIAGGIPEIYYTSGLSSIRRYTTGYTVTPELWQRSWPFYRHDRGG